MMFFRDRRDAGRQLLELLQRFKDNKNTIVLGLPRGGVVTAAEIAEGLNLPLDVISPRKVGAPGYEELAIGAVTESGEGYFNEDLIHSLGVSKDYLAKASLQEKKESARRQAFFRKGLPPLSVTDKVVILVDDGIATGATMKAAIASLKAQDAKEIIVAVPVGPIETIEELRDEADEVFCLRSPAFFQAVGQFYDNFRQTETEEVMALLKKLRP